MNFYRVLAAALLALAVSACDPMFMRPPPGDTPVAYGPLTEKQIEQASQRYGQYLQAMDAQGVANMYAPDGVWERQSGPLTGRDAIRNALSNTNGVKVLSVEVKTSYISYNGPAVVQTGDITQTLKLPNGKTTVSSVRFDATWIKGANNEWWIKRMSTRLNAKPAGT